MKNVLLAESARENFERDGYVIVSELLSSHETELLREIARADHEIARDRSSRADGEGGAVELVVRNELAVNTIYAAIVGATPLVDAMETLLGDEVYHYHHKMILKEPHVGGAWTWHQDYGYWYNNGCLFPLMASAMIALDKCTRDRKSVV